MFSGSTITLQVFKEKLQVDLSAAELAETVKRGQRARCQMMRANLRLVVALAPALQKARRRVSRLNSRGSYRAATGCREV